MGQEIAREYHAARGVDEVAIEVHRPTFQCFLTACPAECGLGEAKEFRVSWTIIFEPGEHFAKNRFRNIDLFVRHSVIALFRHGDATSGFLSPEWGEDERTDLDVVLRGWLDFSQNLIENNKYLREMNFMFGGFEFRLIGNPDVLKGDADEVIIDPVYGEAPAAQAVFDALQHTTDATTVLACSNVVSMVPQRSSLRSMAALRGPGYKWRLQTHVLPTSPSPFHIYAIPAATSGREHDEHGSSEDGGGRWEISYSATLMGPRDILVVSSEGSGPFHNPWAAWMVTSAFGRFLWDAPVRGFYQAHFIRPQPSSVHDLVLGSSVAFGLPVAPAEALPFHVEVDGFEKPLPRDGHASCSQPKRLLLGTFVRCVIRGDQGRGRPFGVLVSWKRSPRYHPRHPLPNVGMFDFALVQTPLEAADSGEAIQQAMVGPMFDWGRCVIRVVDEDGRVLGESPAFVPVSDVGIVSESGLGDCEGGPDVDSDSVDWINEVADKMRGVATEPLADLPSLPFFLGSSSENLLQRIVLKLDRAGSLRDDTLRALVQAPNFGSRLQLLNSPLLTPSVWKHAEVERLQQEERRYAREDDLFAEEYIRKHSSKARARIFKNAARRAELLRNFSLFATPLRSLELGSLLARDSFLIPLLELCGSTLQELRLPAAEMISSSSIEAVVDQCTSLCRIQLRRGTTLTLHDFESLYLHLLGTSPRAAPQEHQPENRYVGAKGDRFAKRGDRDSNSTNGEFRCPVLELDLLHNRQLQPAWYSLLYMDGCSSAHLQVLRISLPTFTAEAPLPAVCIPHRRNLVTTHMGERMVEKMCDLFPHLTEVELWRWPGETLQMFPSFLLLDRLVLRDAYRLTDVSSLSDCASLTQLDLSYTLPLEYVRPTVCGYNSISALSGLQWLGLDGHIHFSVDDFVAVALCCELLAHITLREACDGLRATFAALQVDHPRLLGVKALI